MKKYSPRFIKHLENVKIDQWHVKVYQVSVLEEPDYDVTRLSAFNHLPSWFSLPNKFNDNHEYHAFLIIHKGSEGIFSIINWWVGDNMLNTHVFLSEHSSPDTFRMISGSGLSMCVWELAVVNHERVSWTKHHLKSEDHESYRQDVLDTIF